MKSIARILSAVVIAATLMAPGLSKATDPCEDPHATILQPANGQLVVDNTTLLSGTPLDSASFSTTGTINVVVEQSCALYLRLVVTKETPTGAVVIHDNTWDTDCGLGEHTETVAIGLDGGRYHFDVTGMSCLGRKFRSDGHGGTILDPPLPQLLP